MGKKHLSISDRLLLRNLRSAMKKESLDCHKVLDELIDYPTLQQVLGLIDLEPETVNPALVELLTMGTPFYKEILKAGSPELAVSASENWGLSRQIIRCAMETMNDNQISRLVGNVIDDFWVLYESLDIPVIQLPASGYGYAVNALCRTLSDILSLASVSEAGSETDKVLSRHAAKLESYMAGNEEEHQGRYESFFVDSLAGVYDYLQVPEAKLLVAYRKYTMAQMRINRASEYDQVPTLDVAMSAVTGNQEEGFHLLPRDMIDTVVRACIPYA